MRSRQSLAVVVALLGLVTGTLSAAGEFMPFLVDRTASELGTLVLTVSLVSFLVTPVGLLVVGYWAGTRIDVASEYGSLLLVLAVVGGGVTAVGYLAVVGFALTSTSVGNASRAVFGVGYNAVVQAVNFAITGFAGAALAQFRGS